MNKRSLIVYLALALAAILLIVLLFNLTAKTWQLQTVDFVGVQPGDYNVFSSLALDSSGNPHICYRSWDWDAKIFMLNYATLTASGWSIQQVASGDIISSSITVDAKGTPHIAYYDYENKTTKVASLTGSNWTKQVINPGPQTGALSNIVFGSDGELRFCYYNQDTQNIEYVESVGGNWSTEIVSNTTGRYVSISLAVDASNHPHVLFIQTRGQAEKALRDMEYAKKTGANWVTSKVDVNASDIWIRQFIVDSKGNPAMVLTRNSMAMDLVRWSDSEWTIQQFLFNGYPVSVVSDSKGNLQLAYSDGSIHYLNNAGSGWFTQKIVANGSISNPSLALDSAGNPHISCNEAFYYGHATFTYAVGYGVLNSPIDLYCELIYVVGLAVGALFLIAFLVLLKAQNHLRKATSAKKNSSSE